MRLGRAVSRAGASLAAASLAVGAAPAAAMPDPYGYVSALSVRYDVGADGVLRVTETIDYTLQPHGGYLTRYYDIREPYRADPGQDQVWEYSNFTASSPAGVPTDLSITELDPYEQGDDSSYDSREAELSVRFPRLDGPARTVRYVLGYRVRGALRPGPGGAAELRDWSVATARPARIDRADVRVTVPSGVRAASCRSSTQRPCTSAVTQGVAQFGAGQMDNQGGMRISITAAPGAVHETGPVLADPPSRLSKLGAGGVVAALLAVALLLAPAIWWAVARSRRARAAVVR